MSSTVKDVMSTRVTAVKRGAGYKEIAALLHEQRVSAFPVVDEDNKVIGVVSESDLLVRAALEGGAPGTLQSLTQRRVRSQAAGLTAADLMTRPAVTVGPGEPVSRAAQLMCRHRVKRLPVVGDDGTLVGIVGRSDVLSVYRRPDAEIQQEIVRDLILGTFGCDPGQYDVTVNEGIVTVAGRPETALTGRGIIAAARHVEGVVAVRDRLSCPTDTRLPADPPPA